VRVEVDGGGSDMVIVPHQVRLYFGTLIDISLLLAKNSSGSRRRRSVIFGSIHKSLLSYSMHSLGTNEVTVRNARSTDETTTTTTTLREQEGGLVRYDRPETYHQLLNRRYDVQNDQRCLRKVRHQPKNFVSKLARYEDDII